MCECAKMPPLPASASISLLLLNELYKHFPNENLWVPAVLEDSPEASAARIYFCTELCFYIRGFVRIVHDGHMHGTQDVYAALERFSCKYLGEEPSPPPPPGMDLYFFREEARERAKRPPCRDPLIFIHKFGDRVLFYLDIMFITPPYVDWDSMPPEEDDTMPPGGDGPTPPGGGGPTPPWEDNF